MLVETRIISEIFLRKISMLGITYNLLREKKNQEQRNRTSETHEGLTTESNGPCLNFPWNENEIGFGLSPGPLINPLKHWKINQCKWLACSTVIGKAKNIKDK